ncbi:PTS sugar transporter subunit IIA [Enterococcus faecium]|uniref:PTS sugar transporter subunit IIA n=1 Tax=Enterococcus TaxID=1350 RepID=UPI000989A2F8|nr:PTS sugar transporter subunit IIA [Enterococcus faecium]MDQ8439619.1 PTS sugar transporter subunit IIA [Enterococcus faecium]MDU5304159.1 PTS sugar transporter subunit IIA [Enterococcus faecium]MDV4936204.1 PTS sugar transporter subunit IIA [Enterococcus faecium]SJX68649.1 PTS system, fructose-specific IIA component / PTS system, fructose-specific IIB component / PTS system, fructose-specific IIC component [Enterococcus faecium]HAQ4409694.1 PTS sugar transporter subunit IIA [Enterococcus fa
MRFDQLIAEELIVFDPSIDSKRSLFERIGDVLEKTNKVRNVQKVVKALFKREEEISTGIEDGFGIPHAKSKYVTKPALCFFHTAKLTDYSGIDGMPIEYIFAIVVPEKSADMHLEILSTLSRRLMNTDFRKGIKEATTPADIIRQISQE